jgi:hypothetical protein
MEGKGDQFLDTAVNEGLDTLMSKNLGNDFLGTHKERTQEGKELILFDLKESPGFLQCVAEILRTKLVEQSDKHAGNPGLIAIVEFFEEVVQILLLNFQFLFLLCQIHYF